MLPTAQLLLCIPPTSIPHDSHNISRPLLVWHRRAKCPRKTITPSSAGQWQEGPTIHRMEPQAMQGKGPECRQCHRCHRSSWSSQVEWEGLECLCHAWMPSQGKRPVHPHCKTGKFHPTNKKGQEILLWSNFKSENDSLMYPRVVTKEEQRRPQPTNSTSHYGCHGSVRPWWHKGDKTTARRSEPKPCYNLTRYPSYINST